MLRVRPRLGSTVFVLAIVAYVVVVAAVAFLYQEATDNETPVGTRSLFRIDSVPDDVPKRDLLEAINNAAVTNMVNIYKISPDPDNVDNGRILFAFVGDEASFFDDQEPWVYPSFSATFKTTLLSYDSITTQDLRGTYAADAEIGAAGLILEELRSQGLGISLEPVSQGSILAAVLFGGNATGPVLVVAIVGLVVGTSYYASRRFTVYTLRTIHGRSTGRAIGDEYANTALIYVIALLSCGVAGTLALLSYNQLHQFGSYLATVSALMLAGFGIILGSQSATFLVMRRRAASETLKGRRPLVFLASVSIVAQLIALAVGFPTISATVLSATALAADSKLDTRWIAARTFVAVRFSGTNTPEDLQAITPRFGELAKQAESHGDLILSRPPSAPIGELAGYGPYSGNSLIVNNRYLDEQLLTTSTGGRIHDLPEWDGGIYLLVPQGLRSTIDAIVAEYGEWAEFQRSLESEVSPATELEIRVVELAPGQEVFNYGANPFQRHVVQRNAVVAVVPASANILSDDFYLAAASSAGVIFTNPNALEEALASADLESHITSVDSISDLALAERTSRLSELRLQIASLIMLGLTLMLAVSVLTSVYCDRNRQRLFVEAIHGRAFIAMHGEYFLFTAGLAGVVLLVLVSVGSVVSLASFGACLVALALLLSATVLLTWLNQRRLNVESLMRN